MHVFNTAFLAAAHGIAVENARPCLLVPVMLQRLRVSELTASVSQYDWKYAGELERISKRFLDLVKLSFYGALCTAVHQPADQEFHAGEIQRQDTFIRAPGGQDSVHLDEIQFITAVTFKVLISPACEYGPVSYGGILLFAGFKFYLAF